MAPGSSACLRGCGLGPCPNAARDPVGKDNT